MLGMRISQILTPQQRMQSKEHFKPLTCGCASRQPCAKISAPNGHDDSIPHISNDLLVPATKSVMNTQRRHLDVGCGKREVELQVVDGTTCQGDIRGALFTSPATLFPARFNLYKAKQGSSIHGEH
eukprot:5977794-Amphidinium_carterae.2